MSNSGTMDSLTGLANRAAFEASFSETLAGAEAGPVSLALIDIDNFDTINKELGHAGGDAVLKAVASLLEGLHGASCARYGGDEFIAVFAGLEREQAFLRLEKLREAAASASGTAFTISVGLAACPIDGTNEAELLRKADGALYRAKIGGRNKVTLAFEERMAPKTSHFTLTQLERLATLAKDQGVGEAVLLREALDDLLVKYLHGFRRQ